jgi:uncharacterized protein
MHINVVDLLTEEIGYNRTFAIEGEQPTMLSLELTQPVSGEITITKLEGRRLVITGSIDTQMQLECHRCLRSYIADLEIDFKQNYSEHPELDELPIIDGRIDLAPLIEQELIVNLPIKLLCEVDCIGIPGVEEYLTKGIS